MKKEKDYIESEKNREEKLTSDEKVEKIVNCVDISDNEKVFIKYSTVTYKNLLKWLVIGLVAFALAQLIKWFIFVTLFAGYYCFSILMTILFNGIKTLELKENSFLYSSEKEDIDYKPLEYFIITTHSGDFLAYRNNRDYWRTIPSIAFPDKTIHDLLKNYLLEKIPASQSIINSGGEEIFYVRDEEDIKKDYRKRDFFGKRRDRVFRAMRDKVVPLNRLQEEVRKAYEENSNKLVIKKEGLVIKGEIHPWERLKPIKLAKSFGGLVEIKTLQDETVFSSRTTAITRVPLFEALYNSMIKERKSNIF